MNSRLLEIFEDEVTEKPVFESCNVNGDLVSLVGSIPDGTIYMYNPSRRYRNILKKHGDMAPILGVYHQNYTRDVCDVESFRSRKKKTAAVVRKIHRTISGAVNAKKRAGRSLSNRARQIKATRKDPHLARALERRDFFTIMHR